MFTDKLGKIFYIFDAYCLIENGHGGTRSQICIHKQQRLKFLMIGSKGVKGYEVSLFDNSSQVINVSKLIKIFFYADFPFLNNIYLIDLSVRQTPENLSNTHIRLIGFIIKVSYEYSVRLTRFPQGFFSTLARSYIVNF